MDRRDFLGIITGAVAAITAANLLPAAKPQIRVYENEEFRMPDGFEVCTYCQPMDADYFEFHVRKWKDGDIVSMRTYKANVSSKEDIQAGIEEIIQGAMREMS